MHSQWNRPPSRCPRGPAPAAGHRRSRPPLQRDGSCPPETRARRRPSSRNRHWPGTQSRRRTARLRCPPRRPARRGHAPAHLGTCARCRNVCALPRRARSVCVAPIRPARIGRPHRLQMTLLTPRRRHSPPPLPRGQGDVGCITLSGISAGTAGASDATAAALSIRWLMQRTRWLLF